MVKSTAVSVFQHEPFSWLVEDGDFVCQKALNRSARVLRRHAGRLAAQHAPRRSGSASSRRCTSCSRPPRRARGESSSEKLLANTRRMIGSGSRLDPDTRKFLLETLGGLVAILKEETVKAIRPAPRNWLAAPPRGRRRSRPIERKRFDMSTISTTQAAEADDHAAARRPQGRLTPRMAVQLAAPHTWPAAVFPVLVALACAVAETGRASAVMACALLAICVLMQSAVNTVQRLLRLREGSRLGRRRRGPDRRGARVQRRGPSGGAGARHRVSGGRLRRSARTSIVERGHRIPLVHRRASGAVVRGACTPPARRPFPICPSAKLASGFVMGGLIPLASYLGAHRRVFDVRALLWAVPTILGVGPDHDRRTTRATSRRTWRRGAARCPCMLGTRRGRGRPYHGLVFAWLASIVVHGGGVLPKRGSSSWRSCCWDASAASERAGLETRWRRGRASGPWRQICGLEHSPGRVLRRRHLRQHDDARGLRPRT